MNATPHMPTYLYIIIVDVGFLPLFQSSGIPQSWRLPRFYHCPVTFSRLKALDFPLPLQYPRFLEPNYQVHPHRQLKEASSGALCV